MTRLVSRMGLLATVAAACWGCGWGRTPECRSPGVPDAYPLGAVNRAHYHTMQANAEAAEFILHQNEFVGSTTELTPAGKDHLLEIGARARSTPFPILVERSENNATPELDERRRASVVQVLTQLGVGDAGQKTVIAPAYGKGLTGHEAEFDAALYQNSRLGSGVSGAN